jgi:carboxylesterase
MTRTGSDDQHPVLAGAEPMSAQGGPAGALVLHGFTGNPLSMRGVAEALAGAGFAVEMPRLPGHGTHVDDMVKTGWDDWRAEAERAYVSLTARCDRVVVVGLSMGGALTLSLAVDHPEIAGIVCINTPAGVPEEMAVVLRDLAATGAETMDSIGGDIADPDATEMSYDKTPLAALVTLADAGLELRPRLGEIACPVLIITSANDHVVPPADSDTIAETVAGPVERLVLERSYHVATVDYDKELVFSATVDFAKKVTAA